MLTVLTIEKCVNFPHNREMCTKSRERNYDSSRRFYNNHIFNATDNSVTISGRGRTNF